MMQSAKIGLSLVYFMAVMGAGADPATAAFSSWVGAMVAGGVLARVAGGGSPF